MSFLSPIWLFSVAAISIPLLIHLWNIRPGKTLKVGSIALIENSSRKHSRSFKLLDILLLLLRCLLLITVAFVLAMPYLKKHAAINAGKGWLLIPKEDFKEAYQKFKPKADSLLNAGYELHYFNSDFPKTTVQQALADSTGIYNARHTSYWNLLQQLERQVPGSLPVYLITPDMLNKFTGYKPNIALKLQWQTYTPADSVATRIKSAWFTADKDVHVLVNTSKPSGTFYHTENINPAALKNSAYTISIANGKATISLKKETLTPVGIDTAALKIDVFSGSNLQDAGYVNAGLLTIGQFTQRNIIVKPYIKSNEPVTKAWLFWLSDKPLDKSILTRYSNVLMYETGKAAAVDSWIISGSKGNEPVPLYRYVKNNNKTGEDVWKDGFGNPVLTAGLNGKTMLYHFYSHFNPAWNDLVWNADFPKIMLQLIMTVKEPLYVSTGDRRRIDHRQMLPNSVKGLVQQGNYKSRIDIAHYFWLFLALIFILERWLAHRKAEGASQ